MIIVMHIWKWRILLESETIWSGLIRFKYGKFETDFLCEEDFGKRNNGATWWRDLRKIGVNSSSYVKSFASNIVCIVSKRTHVPFWKAKWIGDVSLQLRFPKNFQVASLKKTIIL